MKPNALTAVMTLAGILGLCHIGCDDAPAPAEPAAVDAPAAAPVGAPAPKAPDFKPEYTVAIQESDGEPRQYTVTWSARVNTGGWTMKTDNVLVEEQMGAMAARIWVTLEAPNPSDVVTEAFETLTGKHEAGQTKIERVEFSVRRTVRGATSDTPPTYAVVKTIKYPY